MHIPAPPAIHGNAALSSEHEGRPGKVGGTRMTLIHTLSNLTFPSVQYKMIVRPSGILVGSDFAKLADDEAWILVSR